MATINTFEELEIWILSREICQDVWDIFERNGRREFINFLSYSKGSCGELRSQLYRAFDRKYITKEEFEFLKEKTITESKKIGSFMSYLVKSDNKGSKFDK